MAEVQFLDLQCKLADILGRLQGRNPNCKPYPPTVHRLFYLLGDLSTRWRTIGNKLRFPENKLSEINDDQYHKTSFRRMIEMFEQWLLEKNPSWSDIVQLLLSINEKDLAGKISAYISEMERLPESMTGQLVDKRMMPIKGFSFEDKIIRNVYYENEKLARKSITQLQEFNEIVTCLMDVRHKWYELGIALGVPKAKLDEIDHLNPLNVDSKMRLMLQYTQEILSFKFTWRRLIDALIDLDLNRCVESLESIAPKHTTCTNLCRLDVYRRQDFVSKRTGITEDRRFIKQVEEIRNILELGPSITDDEVLSCLFQHISSKKADLSSEERIIEALRVIQKLSLEHALESEQEADDIVEHIHTLSPDCYKQQRIDYKKRQQHKSHLSSAIDGLNLCISSVVKSKETLQQAIDYIKEMKPHHEDLLKKALKGVSVGGIVGAVAGAGVFSIPFGLAGAVIGGAAAYVYKHPEVRRLEKLIEKLEEILTSVDKDLSAVNDVMKRLQDKRDFIQHSCL